MKNSDVGMCAAHFLPTSLNKGVVRSRLVGPAVPIPFNETNSTQETADADVENDNLLSSPEVLKVKTPTKVYQKRCNIMAEVATSRPSSSLSSCSLFKGPIEITPTQRMSRKSLFEGPKKRLSRKCLFEQKAEDAPRTKKLKNTASILLKKNESQRLKIRGDRQRTKSELKASIDAHEFRSEISKTLAVMQLRKTHTTKKWTEEEKKLCLSLYYKYPEAYTFLRRQGVVLASPSTIKMWLSKSNCLPGLCPDVFIKIQQRFKNASIKEKSCVISFDEMSIMSNLDYTKKYDFIEGFEDLGGNHRCNKVAKYALVFIIRGLYGKWKFPIAYFLSGSNVKSETLTLLLKAIINKLFDSGVLPKAVVCDQATTNQTAFKKLGVTSRSPFFFCGERKLFALFDVPHLIKNIRNNFLESDYVNNKEQMSFQDIVKTYELDKNSNKSRSLTKLTDRHLKPNLFQKMTVSLATQVLSNSVAAAITTAQMTGELNSTTANNTTKFIKIVNNMFDALNSKRRYDSNPYRHALSNKSTYAFNAIVEGQKMFEKLYKISYKFKDGGRKKCLTRPPCFEGVVQTCEAVLQLHNEECSDPCVSYIITSKLNQDVLENLFARCRQKGGCNKNPTARLLRTLFRSNLVNSLIKLPTTKNCEDEEDKFINLAVGDDVTAPSQIPTTSGTNIARAEQSSATILPPDAMASSCKKNKETTLEECSVAYFAGYLAYTCIKNTKCQNCLTNLVKEIDLEDEKQMLILKL